MMQAEQRGWHDREREEFVRLGVWDVHRQQTSAMCPGGNVLGGESGCEGGENGLRKEAGNRGEVTT